jgi:hypothetical protein
MRKPACIILSLLLSAGSLIAQSPPGSENQEIAERFADVRSFHPRYEGSAGEASTLSYISAILESGNLRYEVQDLTEFDDAHSFSRNLIAFVPGRKFSGTAGGDPSQPRNERVAGV